MTMPLASLTDQITNAVATHGAYAIFVLMALDAALPLGGELIMLYAGVITAGVVSAAHVVVLGTPVAFGAPTYVTLVAAGTLGSLAGGLVAYGIGAAGGQALIGRGRWGTASQAPGVERARAWVERHGVVAVFVGRLTPLVRSVVSYPAGALRVPLGPYLLATLLSGVVWCLAFAGVGWALGGAWVTFHRDFRYADYATIAAILAALVLVTMHRARVRRATG
jgi:membrane protein DedA with SNARE-associated domain